jgi:sugar lactone lactonase YvrE
MRNRKHPESGIFLLVFFLLPACFCFFPATADASTWKVHDYIQNAICMQPDGDYIWIGSTTGVFRVKCSDGTFVQYTTKNGLVNSVVMDIAIDGNNNKWFATLGGVSRFDGLGWVSYTQADGLVSNQVRAVAIDSSGVKWFGTAQGACSYNGNEWIVYTDETGLAGNLVNDIAADASGNIWFGTDQGVSRLNGTKWTTYTTATGLAHNKVNAIAVDDSGNRWFGTDNGVSHFGNSTWTTYRSEDGLAADLVNDIAVDKAGHKWFGCYGGGVSEFFEDGWTGYTEADGLISNQVTAVATDRDGHIWIGTAAGVSEFDKEGSLPDTDEDTSDGDMNDDGISDDNQDNVDSLPLSGGEYLTAVSSEGTRITGLTIDDIPSSSAAPSDLDFIYGLIGFTVENVGAGKSAVVTLHFPEEAAPSTYYKYGPTPDQPADHWYEFMFNGETGAEIDGNVVTLHFIDGKRGDDVYTLDGKIMDIGGPGFRDAQTDSVAASTSSSSGGSAKGGCFLECLNER